MMRTAAASAALALSLLASPALAQGTLRIGLTADPNMLDPAQSSAVVDRVVYAAMCDKLIDLDTKMGFVPQLATAWAWGEDGRSLTLTLREGVTFHDGTPMDAAAVKVNLDRYREVHLGRGRIAEARSDRVAGRAARRYRVEHPDGRSEGIVLVEGGDGRVVVVLWDCPSPARERFAPWFEASLATLELRAARSPDRDYLGARPGP